MIPARIKGLLVKKLGGKERVLFYHIAKCGGMSTIHALVKAYRLSRILSHQSVFQLSEGPTRVAERSERRCGLSFRQEALLYVLANRAIRLAGGHFELSAEALGPLKGDWKFVTVLRDPVDRWFSQYFYNFGRSGKFGIHEELGPFLESDYAQEMGRLYVRHFSHCFDVEPEGVPDATEAAIENVRRFDLIGRTDRMGVFAEDLRRVTGLRFRFAQHNVGANRRRRAAEIDAVTVARVRELCRPDYAVFEAVFPPTHGRDTELVVQQAAADAPMGRNLAENQ